MPVITQLVKGSVRGQIKYQNGEGTSKNQSQIQQTIGEALSTISVDLERNQDVEEAEATSATDEPVQQDVLSDDALSRWQEHGPDKELYGSTIRCEQLRDVISQALTNIGILSAQVVERTLIELAADSSREVQAVAASAMARWHASEYGGKHNKLLFKMLRSWQTDTRLLDLFELLLTGSGNKKGNPRGYIRATVALAVSYAALYDAPDQLTQELLDLISTLAKDTDNLVRDRFRNHTLPLTISRHLNRMQAVLREIVIYADLIPAIGTSLAFTYQFRANEVIEMLGLWHQDAKEMHPTPIEATPTQREAMLATVALTYGYVDYEADAGPLTAHTAFKELENILGAENHPFVRTAVVLAISLQARQHFTMVEPLLHSLVAEVVVEERDDIVEILTDVYLDQRLALKGGDGSIKVKGRTYRVWVEGDRPLTEVEKAMRCWVKDSNNPAAQQIALQTSVAFFEVLGREEDHYIQKKLAERRQAKQAKTDTETKKTTVQKAISRRLRRISAFDSLILWLATLSAESYRVVINNLFPEATVQKQKYQQAMTLLLKEWRQVPDKSLQTISKGLGRAFFLKQNMGCCLVLLLVFGAFALCMVCSILSNL